MPNPKPMTTGNLGDFFNVAKALNTFGVTGTGFVKKCFDKCEDEQKKRMKDTWKSTCCGNMVHLSCAENGMLLNGTETCPLCLMPLLHKTPILQRETKGPWTWTKVDWASPECSPSPEATEEEWNWTEVDWASPTCDPSSVSFDSDDEPAHAPWYSAGINMPRMMAEKLPKE